VAARTDGALSADGMDVAMIAQVTFTGPDRVRDVLHNFNSDGFDSLRPKYAGGRASKFDTAQRAQVKQIALARPADHGLPFSTLSLSKLADYLVAQGVVEGISDEGLRTLLCEEGVSFPDRQDLEDQPHPPRHHLAQRARHRSLATQSHQTRSHHQ
jgi:transposase